VNGLFLAPLIAIAVLVAIALVLAAQKGRQSQLMGHVVRQHPAHGMPSILFFTGETCAICHTAQKPALETLATSIGSMVDIQEIDVANSPDLARAYRVMTLPTTVVLDAAGRVTQINVGFAAAEKLRAQLAKAGVPVPA
jgi:thioredoxin-like negative regulator of GroEL